MNGDVGNTPVDKGLLAVKEDELQGCVGVCGAHVCELVGERAGQVKQHCTRHSRVCGANELAALHVDVM
jgi:hypothetical protein